MADIETERGVGETAAIVAAVRDGSESEFATLVERHRRACVASGVGTLTWITFLPFALTFGTVSKHAGVHTAGWMMVAVTVATSAALVRLAWARRANPAPCAPSTAAATPPLATLGPAG